MQRRQDIQLQKFFAPFSGWFLTPKMRYYLYVWSSNASQGDPAQVVGGGNLSWTFNRFVTVGAGITSLPAVRSTEGQFPYWLGVDDRLIADEFFRGSYTSGVWLKGEFPTKVKYHGDVRQQPEHARRERGAARQHARHAVLLGRSGCRPPASSACGTRSATTTITRSSRRGSAVHFTHSLEDKQSQPGTEGIENSQIRLTDGSVIFTPDLFGPGITVNEVDYRMIERRRRPQVQGHVARGRVLLALAERLRRHQHRRHPRHQRPRLSAAGLGDGRAEDRCSSYFGDSQIFGRYGDPWEVRGGANLYPMKQRGFRVNGEWIYVNHSPVGYTAVSLSGRRQGHVFHINLEMNF